ncbi:MAG: hypothetical protein JWQ02_1816 [Capsulimonas sp.]|jgi:tetratricopeptide (TPR) repeat protein|nr:hypothetical protein [Capsulimonas sp.]
MPELDSDDFSRESDAKSKRSDDSYYRHGVQLAAAGQTRGAIEHFREAVRRCPASFDAYYWLIDCLVEEQEKQVPQDNSFWEDILRLCSHALTLETSDQASRIRVLSLRGYAQCSLGQFHAAIATMRAVIDARPESLWAHQSLQILQFRTSDWVGSFRTMKALMSLPDFESFNCVPSTECKRRLTGYALLAVGGVLLVGYLRRRRETSEG